MTILKESVNSSTVIACFTLPFGIELPIYLRPTFSISSPNPTIKNYNFFVKIDFLLNLLIAYSGVLAAPSVIKYKIIFSYFE